MPLNTDPNAISDEEYDRRLRERIERVGEDGLHTIPADVLAEAMRRASGSDQ